MIVCQGLPVHPKLILLKNNICTQVYSKFLRWIGARLQIMVCWTKASSGAWVSFILEELYLASYPTLVDNPNPNTPSRYQWTSFAVVYWFCRDYGIFDRTFECILMPSILQNFEALILIGAHSEAQSSIGWLPTKWRSLFLINLRIRLFDPPDKLPVKMNLWRGTGSPRTIGFQVPTKFRTTTLFDSSTPRTRLENLTLYRWNIIPLIEGI